jgi:type VI secretion system protein ImpC
MAEARDELSGREERLDQLVAEYLQALETGHAPRPDELIARHPDLGDDLRRYFANREAFAGWVQPLEATGSAAAPVLASWSADDEPVPGYRLVSVLGKGGVGEVWEARGPGGVPIALKRVPVRVPCGQRELAALELLKRIRHPHLLAVHGYWLQGDDLVIGLELAEESLRRLLQRHQQGGVPGLPRDEVVRYLADAAEALDYLGRPVHRVNGDTVRVQHRDVKPANLLLQGGAVKVADFGLAKALRGVVPEQTYSMTVPYAPPEFFRGETMPTSDQYSLGVTYYELRTGRLPFTGSPSEVMHGHLHRAPDLTGLTDRERDVVARALAKDPALRWAGCVKFIGEVARAADGTPAAAAAGEPAETAEATPRPCNFRGKPVTSGLLLAGDDLVPIPLRRTDVRAAVTAACAEVTVTQVFVNTHARALEATYVFPLPEDAAVHGLRMRVGERVIEGVVREKAEARATYEEAKREGHGAALVEETTPNVFTSSVANILPGQEVQVEIRYLQPLPFAGGRYRFVFPMVVSPRYVLGSDPATEPLAADVPAAVTAPRLPQGFLRGDAVSLEFDLDAGVPVCGFDSPSHDLTVVEDSGATRVRLALRRADEIPNRDFVLNYRVAGPRIEHALFCEPGRDDQPGTFLVVTTPPLAHADAAVPREVVFVIDRSGSMGGEPLEQAKQAARQLLDRLDAGDAFNIVTFDTAVTSLAAAPMSADEANLRRGHHFIDQIDSGGGTEMLEPLRLALLMPPAGGQERVRMVVFLTDGSVSGERELLAALRPAIGRSRIVAFGIGTAVNRHLVNKLTAAGRGFAEYLFPGENIARAVDRTLQRLGHAVLTDVELQWEGGTVEEVLPERCPDVYRDQPLVVLGRYRGVAPPALTVRGRLGGAPYEARLDAPQARRHEGGAPLTALWARQRIEELTDRMWEQPAQETELRKQVIELAKKYRLASPFTSFLAVEYRSKAEREQAQGAAGVEVPQYLPQGMDLQNLDAELSMVASIPKFAGQADLPSAGRGAETIRMRLDRCRPPRVDVKYEPTGAAHGTDVLDHLLQRFPDQDRGKDLVRTLLEEALKGVVRVDKNVTKTIKSAMKALDETLSKQLAAIMHHPKFQQLEGTWRGLSYLVMNSNTRPGELEIKVLNVSKRELFKLADKAVEYDQSQLFKKLYESEFGSPGGQPYGAVIGDYEFSHEPDDVELLFRIAKVASAVHCPFLAGASARILGLENWADLVSAKHRSGPEDLSLRCDGDAHAAWRAFRQSEESRYVALTMPRALARLPYGKDTKPIDGFDFEEVELDPTGKPRAPATKNFTWMNTAYVLGSRMTDAYDKSGTCTAIRGGEGGAKIQGLPTYVIPGHLGELDRQCSTEVGITSRHELELSKLGFTLLSRHKDTVDCVFFGAETVQNPKKYDTAQATADAAISSRLPYVMAVSRFAQYLAVMARDWFHSLSMEAPDVEARLNRWISQYANPLAQGQDMRVRFPLAEARVQVTADPWRPGQYLVIAYLRPWLIFEELTAALAVIIRVPKLN